MRAQHNSLDTRYRSIAGAVAVGEQLRLTIDIWDDVPRRVVLRTWTDEEKEKLVPMRKVGCSERRNIALCGELNGGCRYGVTLTFDKPQVLWYSFQMALRCSSRG